MLVTKTIRADTKALDEEGRVSAVVSTETQDRDGDIIRQSGWKLDNFQKNPVLIDSHNYGSVRNIIGHWESMEVRDGQLQGVAKYYVGDDAPNTASKESAVWAHYLARQGKGAFSVGFAPNFDKAEPLKSGKGYEFKEQELLEVSQVVVPSNPTALQLARHVTTDPVLKQLIDEELSRGPTDDDGKPTYSQAAIKAGLREIVREILAEIGAGADAPSGTAPANAEGSTPAAPSILEILGVDE